MYTSLKFEGFRCFDTFEMAELGQINLLVGKNNSGKTTALEAINALECNPDIAFALLQSIYNRGDGSVTGDDRHITQIDFTAIGNWARSPKQPIVFSGAKNASRHSVAFDFGLEQKFIAREPGQVARFDVSDRRQLFSNMAIRALWSREKADQYCVMLEMEHTAQDWQRLVAWNGHDRRGDLKHPRVQYIPLRSWDANHVIALWDTIATYGDEDRVVEALRFLEPRVEKIAPWLLPGKSLASGRGGFHLRLRGIDQRVAIGSLGDGMWTILTVALGIIRARDSILLIDEIDTGLHYSTMERVWRFIDQTAKAYNVQVFATTHSRDCIEALAAVCNEEIECSVSVQRLEAGKPRAVAFSKAQLATMPDHGWLEVR